MKKNIIYIAIAIFLGSILIEDGLGVLLGSIVGLLVILVEQQHLIIKKLSVQKDESPE